LLGHFAQQSLQRVRYLFSCDVQFFESHAKENAASLVRADIHVSYAADDGVRPVRDVGQPLLDWLARDGAD
jgi:hypothetical protein